MEAFTRGLASPPAIRRGKQTGPAPQQGYNFQRRGGAPDGGSSRFPAYFSLFTIVEEEEEEGMKKTIKEAATEATNRG